MNFDARLRKLEQQRKNSGLPAVLILYQMPDGALQDSDGRPFDADIPSTALVIKYQMPADDGRPSGRMISPHVWSAIVSAEQKARDAVAQPPRPQAEPQAPDTLEQIKAEPQQGYETRRPRSTQSAINQSEAHREFFGRSR